MVRRRAINCRRSSPSSAGGSFSALPFAHSLVMKSGGWAVWSDLGALQRLDLLEGHGLLVLETEMEKRGGDTPLPARTELLFRFSQGRALLDQRVDVEKAANGRRQFVGRDGRNEITDGVEDVHSSTEVRKASRSWLHENPELVRKLKATISRT